MSQTAIWLEESDVASLVSLNDTIGALESSLRSVAVGEGLNIPKALGSFDDGSSMHSLGSALPSRGYCGFKNWINTKRGAKAVYMLFDSNEGRLVAMMEANALGQLRTAAMTGVGTKWVAKTGASDMAVIGSGRQALMQVAAVNAVRPLKRLRVWSPTPEKRESFAAELAKRLPARIDVADTLESATDGAEIVTLITRARDPFLHSSVLAPGTHLNAVGAILPTHAEFNQEVFERIGLIAVDDVNNARRGSRELIEYFDKGAGKGEWERVKLIGDVIAGVQSLPESSDITLFKSMGTGISDLSVAMLAYERAIARQLGQRIALSGSATLRWDEEKLG